ncbi:MAG: tRNA (guanosine(46)-N7)-methyltransferase TrmB [Eubacterium sp.]|nr:tRNA (guanosine(46)-N7)-methyltransferase TrmB [Eubacterium sp.]
MRQRKIKNLEEKMECLSELTVVDSESVKGRWRELFTGQGAAPGETGLPVETALMGETELPVETALTGETALPVESAHDEAGPYGTAAASESADDTGEERPLLYAEVGCGKGQFIKNMALIHPDREYVAFEGNKSVVYHAMQKADESSLTNIRFVTDYIDMMDEFFDDGELDGIYLNFSDPWPKYKHEKRRLTAGKRFDSYVKAVKSGGFIEFRTDNDDLFDYTMDEVMEQSGISIIAVTRDLHGEIQETASRIDLAALTDCAFEDGADEKLTTLEDLSVTSEYEDKFSSQGKSINFIHVKVI